MDRGETLVAFIFQNCYMHSWAFWGSTNVSTYIKLTESVWEPLLSLLSAGQISESLMRHSPFSPWLSLCVCVCTCLYPIFTQMLMQRFPGGCAMQFYENKSRWWRWIHFSNQLILHHHLLRSSPQSAPSLNALTKRSRRRPRTTKSFSKETLVSAAKTGITSKAKRPTRINTKSNLRGWNHSVPDQSL